MQLSTRGQIDVHGGRIVCAEKSGSPFQNPIEDDEAIDKVARVLFAWPLMAGYGMYLPLMAGTESWCGDVSDLARASQESFGPGAGLDSAGCGQVVFEVGGAIAPHDMRKIPVQADLLNSSWDSV